MLLFQALFSHAFSLYYRAAQNFGLDRKRTQDKFGVLIFLKYILLENLMIYV